MDAQDKAVKAPAGQKQEDEGNVMRDKAVRLNDRKSRPPRPTPASE